MVKRILTLQIMKLHDLFGRLLLEVQRINRNEVIMQVSPQLKTTYENIRA
jgi:hypothetical protein